MRSAPIGIADVVRAADALDLRGDALAAMVEMFGFTLPSDQAPAERRRTRGPASGEDEDDAAGSAPPAATIEAMPPSARKLEPVRRSTTTAAAWTDPLTQRRDARQRAADREHLRRATCRVDYLGTVSTGYLVSGKRIVTSGLVRAHGDAVEATVTFPGLDPSPASVVVRGGRGQPSLLEWREPRGDIAPLTFGRAATGSWIGHGFPGAPSDAGMFFTGDVFDRDGRDLGDRPALMLTSPQLTPDRRGGAVGMPLVQNGRVVGHLEADVTGRATSLGYARRAEDFVERLLPGETLHGRIDEPRTAPPHTGLFAPRDAVSLLRFAASTPSPSDRVDVPRVVDRLSRAEPLLSLPRLQVPSLALGAQLLVDVGAPMQSFREDQQELVDRFRHALRGLADIRYVGDDPQAGAGRDRRRSSWKAYDPPRPGTPVIALTDLGCGFPYRVDAARAWLTLAARLRRRRCRLVAFAPVRVARVSPELRRALDLVVWDRAARRRNLSHLTRLADG